MRSALLAAAVGLAAALTGGGTGTAATAPAARPIVVAGENFYGDVTSQIAGNHVSVISIISDPNADPHEYESSASDAASIARASLIIMNGLGYDDFIPRMMKASPNPNRKLINVEELLGHHDGDNVHQWYDPSTMPKVSQLIADDLSQIDPANAQYYRDWENQFLQSLKPLDDKVAEMKAKYAGTPVAFTEPVFGYMAQAIGFVVKTPEPFVKAIEDGIEPPASAIAENYNQLKTHQVKVLLYNIQTVTPITTDVQRQAKGFGIPVVGVSETEPLGKSYQQWMLDQLNAIDQALSSSK